MDQPTCNLQKKIKNILTDNYDSYNLSMTYITKKNLSWQ